VLALLHNPSQLFVLFVVLLVPIVFLQLLLLKELKLFQKTWSLCAL